MQITTILTIIVLCSALVIPLAMFAQGGYDPNNPNTDFGEIDTGPSAGPNTDPNANIGALGEDVRCTSGVEGTCVNVTNLPGGSSVGATGGETGNAPVTPQDYLSNLYNFLLGFVGVAAMGSIVYGGVLYIISAGNPSQVGSAKQAIWNGIIGILIAGFGYLILFTINPDLVGGFDLEAILQRNLPAGVSSQNGAAPTSIGENIAPLTGGSNVVDSCQASGGQVISYNEGFVCLGKDAEQRQKITENCYVIRELFGCKPGGTLCTESGGKIITLGTGNYCSKSYK